MKKLVFALMLVIAGCSGGTEETSPKNPGVVSVRFTNPTAADLFVDATYRPYEFTQGNQQLPGAHDCVPTCGQSCQCYACGAPLDVVRRIPPNGTWEIAWDGTWYQLVKQCGGGQCDCDAARLAPYASTSVAIVGARARSPADGAPMPSEPELFQGSVDTSAGTCTGTATFQLDAQPKTVDVPFSCTQ